MEDNNTKKSWKTWAVFGGAAALVLAGLVLHLLRPSHSSSTAAAVTPPPPAVTATPIPTPPPVPTPAEPPVVVVEPVVDPVPPQPPTPPPAPVTRPRIEVVFALDTTSSMVGLIEGAKQKIWSIASRIASGTPTPELRVGLVPYRDRGDEFVTRVYPLTANLDEVYARLRSFRAVGGGDPPEDVRQALTDSIRKMDWSPGNVMKIIFLVGDSPSHTDYPGQLDEHALAAEAKRKGIVINTIRCGDLEDTAHVWKILSRGSGGTFSSIGQDGGMVAVRTPLDERLRELNERLSNTAVYFGDDSDRRAAEKRAETNRSMEAASQAESARFRAVSGFVDTNDLVGAAAAGRIRVEDLPADALPAPMQAMAPAARRAYVEEKKAEREKIAAEIRELSRRRDEYLRSAAPAGPSFDQEVQSSIARQAAKFGISYH